MGERVVVGKLADGTFGLQVSKENVSATGGANTDQLLFDSRRSRVGIVYAGGFQSSLSSALNFRGTKTALSYIPLVTVTETAVGEDEGVNTGNDFDWMDNISFFQFKKEELTPFQMYRRVSASYGTSNFSAVGGLGFTNRNQYGSSGACTNLSFRVLRIPCAYGYMTDANFTGSGSKKRVLIGKNTNTNHGFSNASPGFGVYVSRPGKDVTTCSADDLIFHTDKGQTGSSFVAAGLFQATEVRRVANVPRADLSITASSTGAQVVINNVYSSLGATFGAPVIAGTSATTTGTTGSGSGGSSTGSITVSGLTNVSATQTITFTGNNIPLTGAIMPTFSTASLF